ncbi:MAG: 2-C-methyl-D-erythritol 4-phosphate cytidylyltransferase [Candidatus Margulisbacteria bacterium]|nr:2-C-methyl-D-erythritol 4-phosphate cytidylyltransferase [Candidatus Margulisiibacteriota bacterium]
MKNITIIVAGGKGKRMGKPKQFLKIAGRPMLAWTLAAFQNTRPIDGIILVVAPGQMELAKKLPKKKIIGIVAGGAERQDSVRNGLAALPGSAEIVLIHDGARPAVTTGIIERSIKEARKHGAVVVGVSVKDTIKEVMRNENRVTRTMNRDKLWQAQTPQVFKAALIRNAYAKLRGAVTDDAMAVEKLGKPVKMVMGSYENIKVTAPEDLIMMEAILKGR